MYFRNKSLNLHRKYVIDAMATEKTKRPVFEPDYDFISEEVGSAEVGEAIRYSEDTLLCRCDAGSLILRLNHSELTLTAGMHFWISSGALVKVIGCSNDLKVTILRFSFNFFNGIYPLLSGEVIDVVDRATPEVFVPESENMLDLIFEQLLYMDRHKAHSNRHTLVANMVVNYLLTVYEQAYRRIDRSEASAAIDRASQLVCVLFDLCAGDAESHRDIGYYAEKMHISPRYLHRICKQSMGYTPKAVIDYVIVGKAKKMLLATGLTVQEIAGRLCFPDQATFGQYFKRNIGMTPTEFRRRYR